MKERGILFSAPMVLALLAGTKTQTRRIAKWKPCCSHDTRGAEAVAHNRSQLVDDDGAPNIAGEVFGTDPYLKLPACAKCDAPGDRLCCPYGVVGDRLWVRETWAEPAGDGVYYRRATFDPEQSDWNVPKWRPSIFMPRRASRMTLTLTDVRIERLSSITLHDARAEGIPQQYGEALHLGLVEPRTGEGVDVRDRWDNSTSVENYARLWDRINGKGAWSRDPFVWALTFTVKKGRA